MIWEFKKYFPWLILQPPVHENIEVIFQLRSQPGDRSLIPYLGSRLKAFLKGGLLVLPTERRANLEHHLEMNQELLLNGFNFLHSKTYRAKVGNSFRIWPSKVQKMVTEETKPLTTSWKIKNDGCSQHVWCSRWLAHCVLTQKKKDQIVCALRNSDTDNELSGTRSCR